MNYIPNTKRHIIELLQLLASEQKQLDYEKSVPIADVPAELFCMWFDDLYYPGSIEAQFDSSEAATLARFNAFYDVERKKTSARLRNDSYLACQSNMEEDYGSGR